MASSRLMTVLGSPTRDPVRRGRDGGPSEARRDGPRNEARTVSETQHHGREIAIVEDDDELLSLLSLLVVSMGHRVEFQAHDGEEIVKAFREGGVRPELVLMDYRMPVMNGIQAAQEILRLGPETRVIIVTADDTARDEAVAAGLGFLQKPFSSAELARAIEGATHGGWASPPRSL